MTSKHRFSPADARRLNKELAQTKRRLYELENGRALRILKFTRQSVTNPLWAFKHVGLIPGLFRAAPEYEQQDETNALLPVAPGLELGSFMQHPNLKVLTVGNVPDLSVYCHHLRLEDGAWLAFHKVGIDVVLISSDVELSVSVKKQIDQLRDEGTLVYALDNKHDYKLHKKLDTELVVDLQRFNPIGINDNQFEKPTTTLTKSSLNVEKSDIHEYSIIECPLNIFKDETKHAQAVLNILSCGVLVATKKTKTLSKYLPVDYPYIKSERDKEKLYSLNKNWLEWKRLSVKYRRHIHLNLSPKVIVDTIAKELTLPETKNTSSNLVSIILSTNRPENLDNAMNNVKMQNYKNKELLLILHGASFDTRKIKSKTSKLDFDVKIIKRPTGSTFGDNLNMALEKAKGEYVTKMDDDDYYGSHHIEDLLAAFEYSRATIVGKWTNITHLESRDLVITFSGGREEKYVHHLPGATLFTKTEILKKVRFGHVKRAIDTELYRRLESRGGTFYSTHSMNFIRVRHDKGHTYNTDIEDFIAHSTTKPVKGLDKQKYFI